jgi:hypothetical protein
MEGDAAVDLITDLMAAVDLMGVRELKVGRCRLTVSKPVLKAPMVSALQALI